MYACVCLRGPNLFLCLTTMLLSRLWTLHRWLHSVRTWTGRRTVTAAWSRRGSHCVQPIRWGAQSVLDSKGHIWQPHTNFFRSPAQRFAKFCCILFCQHFFLEKKTNVLSVSLHRGSVARSILSAELLFLYQNLQSELVVQYTHLCVCLCGAQTINNSGHKCNDLFCKTLQEISTRSQLTTFIYNVLSKKWPFKKKSASSLI